jgi:anthranilate/para-aminobenzoate synthase component I
VNRPLAGTRRRGKTPEEDEAMEKDLLADEKECAEHVMLVDVGKVEPNRIEASSNDFESFLVYLLNICSFEDSTRGSI